MRHFKWPREFSFVDIEWEEFHKISSQASCYSQKQYMQLGNHSCSYQDSTVLQRVCGHCKNGLCTAVRAQHSRVLRQVTIINVCIQSLPKSVTTDESILVALVTTSKMQELPGRSCFHKNKHKCMPFFPCGPTF